MNIIIVKVPQNSVTTCVNAWDPSFTYYYLRPETLPIFSIRQPPTNHIIHVLSVQNEFRKNIFESADNILLSDTRNVTIKNCR